MQHEIASERDRLKVILDSMDDGIYIVGRDYRISFMNLALRSAVGNGEGRLCYRFFGHGKSDCEICQHGMSSFGPQLRRERYLAKTGRTYDMVVSPIHEPDGTFSRIHIMHDITERKRLEAELQEYSQKLEAKVARQAEELLRAQRLALLGEIAAGLAHEIRTPLGAILTGIKLLEKGGSEDGEQGLVLQILQRETARLERKLSEFLIYARPRLPRFKEVRVDELLNEVRAILVTDQALLGGVVVKVVVQSDIPAWPLDADQMKEALLNVCVNALQALQGKGAVTLQAKSSSGILDILVRDNGPGISSEAIPQIFKPFFSLRTGGTGLGLAISREIIESHGGRISVSSIPNLSTTFRITLPRHSVQTPSYRNRIP